MWIDLLFEPLQYSFISRALIVCILVGITCPFLGAFVINREMAFMGDALAHAVLPGLVVAYAFGISPFIGALPTGIIVALTIGYIVKKSGVSNDTSIGIVFSGLFSLGLIILSLTGGTKLNVEDILLGQLLGTSITDVYITIGTTVVLSVVLIVFYRQLVFVGFDFQGAKVAGLPADKLDYLLLILITVVIVMSLQVVGIILVVGMLITPAAASSLIVRRFPPVILLGIVFGVLSAVSGLYLSYYFNLPSGPSIAMVSSIIFAICFAASRCLKA
tara:strand:+ start:1438 stop:2259 length:822 start_codon:yes stop_codon:yes gene_type:complete